MQLVDQQFAPYGGRLSPDGHWLAYASAQTGQFEIFVQGFPTGSPRKKVSNGGGVHPRWTRDGKKTYVCWANPGGGILSNELSITGQEVHVGQTGTLVDNGGSSVSSMRGYTAEHHARRAADPRPPAGGSSKPRHPRDCELDGEAEVTQRRTVQA